MLPSPFLSFGGTQRRQFLRSLAFGSAATLAGIRASEAALPASAVPKLKITKIRYYAAPGYTKPLFNQARGIVEIQTDGGLVGIGEGGSKDTVEQLAQMLIGENPFRIERIWQALYRGMFYPPGREKIHAQGALDMALWDLKGKALGVPVYELLGGATRDYVECYATGFLASKAKTEEERARDCIEAGLRAYRIGPTGGNGDDPFDFYDNAKKTIDLCKRIDAAVGGGGKWAIDLHTRFDTTEGVKICKALETLEPYFVEDIIRSENPEVYRTVRQMTSVPTYGSNPAGNRYSPLAQINRQNVRDLHVARTFDTAENNPAERGSDMQCQPIVAGGVLYGTTPRMKLFAVDATTGRRCWLFDPFARPGKMARLHSLRGVVYWADGADRRILYSVGASLYAVNALTGEPIPGFGTNGEVDLHERLGSKETLDHDVANLSIRSTTPGVLYKDLLILGQEVFWMTGALGFVWLIAWFVFTTYRPAKNDSRPASGLISTAVRKPQPPKPPRFGGCGCSPTPKLGR